MAQETFIDTSGFHALLVGGDDKHAEATAWLKATEKKQGRAVTTDYVLDETVTLLKTKGYGYLLKEFFERLETSNVVRLEWTDKSRFQEVKHFFLRHADHEYSFTDCLSFVVMRGLNLSEALTKDKHFKEAGFTALLLD